MNEFTVIVTIGPGIRKLYVIVDAMKHGKSSMSYDAYYLQAMSLQVLPI